MAQETIGETLKRLRLETGISQRQLAKLSGVDREYICQIEANTPKSPKSITLRTAKALAKGLGKSPAVFLEDEYKETLEEIINRLKSVVPQSIPVYMDYPYHAGNNVRPTDFIYRRPKLAKKGLESYLVYGKCLEHVVSTGDIIIVDREAGITNGDLVACLLNNNLCVARLRKIADELWLENNETRYKFADCQEVALVVEVRKRLK